MTHTSPRSLITAYGVGLVCFLALDACWLSQMGPLLYAPSIGHLTATQVDWLGAALFYLAYIAGLLYFAVLPALEAGQARIALRRGALLGLMAYGTYDLTNQATLRDWPWTLTAVDMAWGGVASGLASFVAADVPARLRARLTSRPASRRSSR